MNYNYDLIIVGAGPGGYIAAERAGKLGLKTAIVEKGTWGGVCLNIGCIPTKTLLKNAKVFHYLDVSEKYGINYDKNSIHIDWNVAQKRKDDVVKKLTTGVQFLMKSNKVDSIVGTASAVDSHTIKVTDKEGSQKTYTAKYLIIATGSKVKMFDNPNVPVTGLSTNDLKNNQTLLTSTEILSLKEIPKSLTVIGGGVIGCEFAALFSTLGTKVTIIEYLPSILAISDRDISNELTKIFINNGIEILTNHSVASLEGNTLTYYAADDKERKNPKTITSDYFLLSTGRIPITEGFENLDLQIKPNGAFAVNNKLEALDKNNQVLDNIYIIGDVTGEKMLAHVASSQGLMAINNILVKEKKANYQERIVNYNQMPSCIYSFPEAASVGLTEEEVKKLYPDDYLSKKIPFSINGKALSDGETDGFVKLIISKKYGEILGAHILGTTATDMIAEIVNIMVNEDTIVELANACHPHPTLSEVVMDVAQDLALQINK
ncbi:dihydrolipoyl dehydrogenase [Spiroplasma platyhelix]|uniref:Dihydrolipoyl dehydrogenase n=1 Tax=Spiroplasma platyhelix PALS-1 TaxID=1276218 RepID=A0A846U5N6_9MOLU|nr:dihydrolipoyl dehydrogenase [Spiroplasma platyhelix]MBE4704395.1 Dihydrolipoyl dehydrogenase [Spiroplasma platyhelix PALS-1]NKE38767.1 dihydrolipoyl dehydrogenase [Spiroplasma platyhelix PALS-1]UJB28978.1 pyruvate dehydrogenase E3 component [Spiroplasma platyhelix PALS-1]